MVDEDEYEAYLAWEKRQSQPEFHRTETRHTKLKRKLDCGHWADGSEPYGYTVWKDRGRGLEQLTACETCYHRDDRY